MSADKVMRTPISKQRNKHIRTHAGRSSAFGAALQPGAWPCCMTGNGQRGDGATGPRWPWHRKLVAHMVAVERRQEQLPAGGRVQADRGSVKPLPKKGRTKARLHAKAQAPPGPADNRPGEGGGLLGGSLRVVSGLAVNTNSIFGADPHGSQTANGCPVLRHAGTTSREAQVRSSRILFRPTVRSPERTQESRAF